ncbi:hypothetical protein YC2023_053855 [Brassica napus]
MTVNMNTSTKKMFSSLAITLSSFTQVFANFIFGDSLVDVHIGSNMHQLHFSNLTLRLTQWDQYASGSTGIIDDTGLLIIGRVPLREQVSYFERSIDYMVRMIGENGTEEMLRKAMLTITIGSNDILNYYIQPSIPSFSQDKLPIDALQNSMYFYLQNQMEAHD